MENLKAKRDETPVMLVKAFLVKDFDYKKDGEKVLIAKNTAILVDTMRQVALIGEDHVEVDHEDYSMAC